MPCSPVGWWDRLAGLAVGRQGKETWLGRRRKAVRDLGGKCVVCEGLATFFLVPASAVSTALCRRSYSTGSCSAPDTW